MPRDPEDEITTAGPTCKGDDVERALNEVAAALGKLMAIVGPSAAAERAGDVAMRALLALVSPEDDARAETVQRMLAASRGFDPARQDRSVWISLGVELQAAAASWNMADLIGSAPDEAMRRAIERLRGFVTNVYGETLTAAATDDTIATIIRDLAKGKRQVTGSVARLLKRLDVDKREERDLMRAVSEAYRTRR